MDPRAVLDDSGKVVALEDEVPDNFTMDVFADWKQMGYMSDG